MLAGQCQHGGDAGGSRVDNDVMGCVAACHKSAALKMHTYTQCNCILGPACPMHSRQC